LNKEILTFLNEYKSDEESINSLIVSAFLVEKNITKIKNQKIKNLVIQKNEESYDSLLEFIKIIRINNYSLGFEELLELFEFVISPSDKLVNGAIYTPKKIREYITTQSFQKLSQKSLDKIQIADIACGCGGFLIDASKILKSQMKKSYKKIFQENIYAVDIQKYSVERTKILLVLLAITEGEDEENFSFNIEVGDTLEYDWKDTKFDIILGNPPYVCSRNMDDRTKILMKTWTTCKTGHPDLYIPFFQIGMELLKPKGVLGFITVNTFIHSVNGRAIREYFEDKKLKLTIIDFGDEQIFTSRLTYTCLCFIENIESQNILYHLTKQDDLKAMTKISFNQEQYTDLNAHNGWSLKDNTFIQKVESRGEKFGDIYDTKSGIATLKNKIYIFKALKKPDKRYYYIDENTAIEKSICKDIINSNRLGKYSDNIEALKEKIIFPYRHNQEKQAVLITEKEFKSKYPKAYAYLESKKESLALRDKGKGKYPVWYAFGRSQSLEQRKEKLFFPQLVKKGFKTFYSEDENLYFYNGMCAFASSKKLLRLQKIMESKIFWKYIENKAKNYASGYYGLGRNYLKDFGVK
jgi:methylase of polypeptide subunit release factors